jgi:hypothetical protein
MSAVEDRCGWAAEDVVEPVPAHLSYREKLVVLAGRQGGKHPGLPHVGPTGPANAKGEAAFHIGDAEGESHYNIVGGDADRSTVTEATLQTMGIPVPEKHPLLVAIGQSKQLDRTIATLERVLPSDAEASQATRAEFDAYVEAHSLLRALKHEAQEARIALETTTPGYDPVGSGGMAMAQRRLARAAGLLKSPMLAKWFPT